MVWTLIEPGIAIVAASLVTVRPLLHKLKIRGFSSADSKAKSNGYHNNNNGRSGGSGRFPATIGRAPPGHRPGDLTLIDLETADFEDRASPNGSCDGIMVNSTVAVQSSRSSAAFADANGRDTGQYNAAVSSKSGGTTVQTTKRTSPQSWLDTAEERAERRSHEAANPWPLGVQVGRRKQSV